VGGEESINSLVEELGTVICLERANSDTILRVRISEKGFESAGSTRLVAKWKRPIKVRVVVDNDKVISKTRGAYNWRCPQITMYQIEDGTRRGSRLTKR
jgi:hypothetical protein